MVVTRNQTAPEPLALLHALVHGNASMARRLLEGSGADQLALVAPASNFTVLHAAVLGGCTASLPQLAALCTAAGVSVDSALRLEGGSLYHVRAAPVLQVLRSLGIERPTQLPGVYDGSTPLSIAVRRQAAAAVDALLQAGARPDASWEVWNAIYYSSDSGAGLLGPLLCHGVDPLSPGRFDWLLQLGGSLLVGCYSDEVASVMLAHLEAQRAAGSLQLGSKQRCAQLLVGACRIRDPRPQLGSFGLSQLEQLVAGGQDADTLSSLLLGVAMIGNPAVLSALLASQLPWDLTAAEPNVLHGHIGKRGYSLLAVAAMSPQPTACVRLLNQAGAVHTATDLYCAIDRLCPDGVTALLACSVPAIDTSQPAATAPLPAGPLSRTAWSCPIHRTLHILHIHAPREPPEHMAALQILEALRAAGFRPTVYADAAFPEFAFPSNNRVLRRLDPLEFYDVQRCRLHGLPVPYMYMNALNRITPWVLFAANDGSWSPATHHHWPDAFKAAARTLLLAANRSSSDGGVAQESSSQGTARRRRRDEAAAAPSSSAQQPGCTLGTLPPELLLRIVKAAAEPLSGWL